MTLAVAEKKEFKVGTTGWTADDLDDPRVERLWDKGRYEIVEGVLTEMPPAQWDSSRALVQLTYLLQRHIEDHAVGGNLGVEVDLIVSKRRVAVVDAVYLTMQDERRQEKLYAKKRRRRLNARFGRLLVAPTLVIEAMSLGHKEHDTETKYRWYAEAGVKNYWLLDSYRRSLKCFVLSGEDYRMDVSGKGSAELRPAMFPGLVTPLRKLWE